MAIIVEASVCWWDSLATKTRTSLFHMVNIIAADDLETQGARASAAMILTQSTCNNPGPHCNVYL